MTEDGTENGEKKERYEKEREIGMKMGRERQGELGCEKEMSKIVEMQEEWGRKNE